MSGMTVLKKIAKWYGILMLVGIGIAFPLFGIIIIGVWIGLSIESKKTVEDDHARLRKKMRWCPDCKRNVRPVRGSPSGGALLATGGLGYVVKDRNSCPVCRGEVLEFPRAPVASEA